MSVRHHLSQATLQNIYLKKAFQCLFTSGMCFPFALIAQKLTAHVILWSSGQYRWHIAYSLRSKGGAVVRALASHQCGPGSNPSVDTICGLSLVLVLSLAPRGFFPGTPVFPSLQKPTFPNSNSTRNQVDEEPLCGCTTCKSLFILFLFSYFFTHKNVSGKFL